MARHEDTVVSRLPNRFLRAATQVSQVRQLSSLADDDAPTSCNGPRGLVDSPANNMLVGLEQGQPPLPPAWGSAQQQQRQQPQRPAYHPAGGTPPPPQPGYGEPRPQIEFHRPHGGPPPHAPHPMAPSSAPITATGTQGKVICMFSCRGGAGATTLSVNMAAQLARAGKSVVLMDLDLQLGDVFVALDLEPQTSIAALAREASTIDGAALKRRLAHHDGGFYALTQTGRIDDIDETLVERMPALLATLTNHFDYVIVDGIRDFSDYALSVLDMADTVGLVLTQDVAAVRRTARVITLFRQLGYTDTKLKLVINRTVRKAAIDAHEIERALRMPVTGAVRNDYKRVRAAFDDGSIIGDVARTSGVAADLAALTQALAQPQPSASARMATAALGKPAKKSLFDFLRKGGK